MLVLGSNEAEMSTERISRHVCYFLLCKNKFRYRLIILLWFFSFDFTGNPFWVSSVVHAVLCDKGVINRASSSFITHKVLPSCSKYQALTSDSSCSSPTHTWARAKTIWFYGFNIIQGQKSHVTEAKVEF